MRDGLLVRPFAPGGRIRLRTVQCAATDPVSVALLAGKPTACFPTVRGWAIGDVVARAVHEHRAWLAEATDAAPSVRTLGRLITAARAALAWESLQAGAPELGLTAQSTLGALAERAPEVGATLQSAFEELHVSWGRPAQRLVARAHRVVRELPAYRAADLRAQVGR